MSLAPHRARKRFSQNFLHDPRFIERIVEAIDPCPGDRIVEIGPGQGAITASLIERAGAIDALEIDRDLSFALRARFAPDQLRLHEGDALRFNWQEFAATRAPLRIAGNLPYHISTPMLFALLPIAAEVADQHFMLQKEVVDRIIAAPGSKTYGRLSVALQFRYRVRKLFDVPPGAFAPSPQVTSSFVRLVSKPVKELPNVDADILGLIVTAAFSQRRKTLRNALSGVLREPQIIAAGVDPKARAETLHPEAFVGLARALAANPR